MKLRWREGNRIDLLENGEAFFPAVFGSIAAAREEVLIETFILFDDRVGRGLQGALVEAARRGVRVDLTVDGYGSPDLSREFVGAMTSAGVRFHVFDPGFRPFGLRLNLLRRLHRKVVSIDGRVAFIGGINYSEDHLVESYGPMAKQDYSVRIEGPLAADIRAFARRTVAPTRRHFWSRGARVPEAPRLPPPAGAAAAALVTRDNAGHHDDIERLYRKAIRAARDEVVIANAYFFPGWRLLRDLVRAARRGVRVQLILQGEPDMAYVRVAARMLYHALVKDGVEVWEYCQRPLHGKVAVIDDAWATVGSSNLDPLSLALNLEANVAVQDADFAAELRARLATLQREHCRRIRYEQLPRRTAWRYLLSAASFHVARGFPRWLQWLPGRAARIRSFDRRDGVRTVKAAEPPAPAAPALDSSRR